LNYSSGMDINKLKLLANSSRALSMDAVQKANSGHPGLPLGMADFGALFYTHILKHYPKQPRWPNRDRFILSAGHGSMFLYSFLHLTGYDLSLEELKKFRQIGSKTPGHPEYGLTEGVETTTGPLGQGFANAVGFAMAERRLAALFNEPGFPIVDHYTYVLCGDGDLQEGISAEAAAIAAHWGLNKLIVFYDSNDVTLDGPASKSMSEDMALRFQGHGWKVLQGSAYDYPGMMDLTQQAQQSDRPVLIILKSTIGYGSPNKAGSFKVHGAPLGADEIKLTRQALGIPDEDFWISPEALALVEERSKEWVATYKAWVDLFERWSQQFPEKRKLWDTMHGSVVEQLNSLPPVENPEGESIATRNASQRVLKALAEAVPGLIGGSADLSHSTMTDIPGGTFGKEDPKGKILNFGVREHAMGAIVNGIVLHGGHRAFGGTFLTFSDYQRTPIRLASLMKIPSIFLYTHDSVFLGEDGPTHQSVEHVTLLRAIPDFFVVRPADAQETLEAWKLILRREEGPSAIILSRQNLITFQKPKGWEKDFAKGGYIVVEPEGEVETVVLATGSEVNLALEALKLTQKRVRVVSISSLELLKANPEHRERLIPSGVRVVACEAGISLSWQEFISPNAFLGIERFGESGPGAAVAKHLGLTAENLARLF